MKAEKAYQQFLAESKYWLKELDYYGSTQFKRQTPQSQWTIGQVYDHLSVTGLKYFLGNVQKCLDGKDSSIKGGKNWVSLYCSVFGQLPPKKFKTPIEGYVPRQPDNTTKAKDNLILLMKEMLRMSKVLEAGYSKKNKIKHPSLGYLNAMDWYTLITIHFVHHRKQKRKIDKVLRKFDKNEVFEGSDALV